jgi:purine-binding chemotaxis protein CheW
MLVSRSEGARTVSRGNGVIDVTIEQHREERAAADAALAGKYMTFRLADEAYGVEIVKVREIIGMTSITCVPRAPRFLRGVIDLRGKVIPVMDLRVQLGMTPAQPTDQSVIIVVQCAAGGGALTIGVLVDQVLEVRAIAAGQIAPVPSLGAGARDGAFILGIGRTDQGVVMLLDVGRLLSDADARALDEAAAA